MLNDILIARINSIGENLDRDNAFLAAIEYYIVGDSPIMSRFIRLVYDILLTIYCMMGLIIRFVSRNQWFISPIICVTAMYWIIKSYVSCMLNNYG
ncbi:Crescent membrane/immature virion protein [Sea otter poxvirus]|uniref:Crescent membrane/immature virion protein n=1 Tax=Sea otter poxvirus TaxID=1416741 RepID=A0A2U9QHP2_9POXV|nr:Crescent membrane/immature virion protein [Sea otter poxvirus]AWU47106.1 Crescent membrane/immature virion protein [Sea otter poxvirus]